MIQIIMRYKSYLTFLFLILTLIFVSMNVQADVDTINKDAIQRVYLRATPSSTILSPDSISTLNFEVDHRDNIEIKKECVKFIPFGSGNNKDAVQEETSVGCASLFRDEDFRRLRSVASRDHIF